MTAALADSKSTRWARVVYTLLDGRITCEWMPPETASAVVMHSPQNGVTVASARIEFGDVLDRWGQSA